MSLVDRVALITGGSHGIGKIIAGRLARDEARVVICGRNSDDVEAAARSLSATGAEVLGVSADISEPAEVERLVASAVARFGRIDILVNSAGIYGPIGPVWENDPAQWQETIGINLVGTFLVCRQVIPLMIGWGRGKVVNMSGGGAATPFPRFSAYAASKAAVVRFTETLALEAAEYNIQVNAVAPGFVATRLHDDTLEAGDRAGDDFLRKTREQLDQGGVDPEIPAALVAFLASEAADAITGKFISAVWDNWRSFGEHLSDFVRGDVYTLRRIVPGDRGLGWR